MVAPLPGRISSRLTVTLLDTAFAIIGAYWPGANVLFEASRSLGPGMNERSRIHRKSLRSRILSSGLTLHFIYVVSAMVVLFLRVQNYVGGSHGDGLSGSSFPLPGAILGFTETVFAVPTPLWYMAFTPTVGTTRRATGD